MTAVAVPAYHYALVKGYLLGQAAPADVLVALEALHMAAVQGPLRDDALEAIQRVSEAAERLAARIEVVPTPAVARPAAPVPTVEPVVISGPTEIELPPLTKMALERAKEREDAATPPAADDSDESKIAAFLRDKGATECPPTHASGGGCEMVVQEPKNRKGWTPEKRAAASERMRAWQASRKEKSAGNG
ncbi:MAG: hypothetical protein U0835_00020 [Isosphaeraceae bacterium]